jgi:hypothetical protein
VLIPRRSRGLALLIVVSALLLGGCTSGTGGTPSFSYSGTWSGSMNDSFAGAGITTMTISQSGSNFVGTWQATFVGLNNGGTLAGVVNGNEVLVELYPSNPSACPFAVVAQRSGTTLAGTYAAFDCTATVTGTVSVAKQ